MWLTTEDIRAIGFNAKETTLYIDKKIRQEAAGEARCGKSSGRFFFRKKLKKVVDKQKERWYYKPRC